MSTVSLETMSSQYLQPLQDRVLVLRDPEVSFYRGLVVPGVAREKTLKGTVVAAGPGLKWDDGSVLETQVKRGDRVVFSGSVNVPYSDLLADGDFVMMSEKDILGIIEGE